MKDGVFTIKSKLDSGPAPRRLQRLCSIPKICRSVAAAILASFGLAQGASAATIGPGIAPITSPVTGFEIDGNLDTGANADWKSILDGSGAPLYPSVFHISDGYNGVNDDVFSGSNKVNDDPGTYLWKVGSVPQKDDVNNALFFLGTDAAGEPWAGVAGDRLAVNGDSYMDFEFLQNTLTMNPDFTFTRSAALTSTGGRAIGDVLITLHFSNGGGQAEFFAQKWAQVGSAYRYVDFSPPATAFVSANIASTVTAPYSVFGSSVPGTYVINQFGEAAINLRRLFEAAGEPCFTATTVFIRTKSSTAVTAELKDLIAPFQLTVTTKPLVEAGEDMTLCSAGATTQFALSGTVSSGSSPITSAAWSATTGPVVISNSAYNPVTGVVTALATVTGASANATVTLTASAQNGCVTSKPLALVVKSTPANPAADNNERCGTGDVALNATGTDLKWYSDANLQIQVGAVRV